MILKFGAVAFDNRCARVHTAPLNERATDASALPTGRASFASVGDPNANFAVQRYAFFLICANFGFGKVRIMRFSGRKGDLGGVFFGIRSRRKGQRRAANTICL